MRIILLILGITLFMSCGKKKDEYVAVGASSSQHEVIVKEFMQASGYTYVFFKESFVIFFLHFVNLKLSFW